MGKYLNSTVPFTAYQTVAAGKYFVDKSALLNELIPAIGMEERFFCITRPRRFGKSVMANMVAAFFGKAADAAGVFSRLEIASFKGYQENLNRHHVIYIDFSEVPRGCASYREYIERIQDGINTDLAANYPGLALNPANATWDILTEIFLKTSERFIFVMDEWDALFHMPFITQKEQADYLLFLKSMLKGKVYATLVYMTGVLPIAKYSDGSELNMFKEYHMATRERFSAYFGFLDEEVDRLYGIYRQAALNLRITRDDLRVWYDGYHTKIGARLYNPRSIICALTDNELANYWTSSGSYDSVFSYIQDNVADIRDDLALLFAGEAIPADIHEYAATSMQLQTKDEVYSAMVVYGLLTYENGCVSIPNKELMDSYAAIMKKEKSLGYIYRLANASRKMLAATLAGDTQTMAGILQYTHNTESPILSYNSEAEFAAVVNLAYLSARDQYRVEREEKAGKGYADFIFYPLQKNADAIILELKADSRPEEAIRQIKDKEYVLRLKGKLGGPPLCSGRILAVGISYNRKTKEHSCLVEVLQPSGC